MSCNEGLKKKGKMVKESDFGRLTWPENWLRYGHFVSQKLHRNRLSVLPLHPLAGVPG